MKQFRKKLVIESWVLGLISAVLIAVQVLAFQRVIRPVAAPAAWVHWVDFWTGMLAGISLGLTALFLFGIIVNIRALRDEKRLKKLYAKVHDERTALIQMQGQAMGMRISLMLMLAAVIVLGYFDIKLSLTVLACTFIQSLITALCKLYWHRTM